MEQKALVRYQKTAQQRSEIVAAFKQSGLSVRQFADQHHVIRSTLERWVADADRVSEVHTPELIEVPNPLAGSGATDPARGHRLHFPRGLVLEIQPRWDVSELRQLIQLIQSV